ncbi:helix-turn-helix domain-containing protein [Pandoraea commovens]|uniref:helix-turn-helix domain-containing protein n=1 Tax=Pandoraea commovens TaxID=2508289 RepID=UPI001FEAA38F|nr:AraC family transcriptional regulator [Pandoraea commovens]
MGLLQFLLVIKAMFERNDSVCRFSSTKPEEVSKFIDEVYTSNRFEPLDSRRDQSVDIVGYGYEGVGVYDVDFEMPFSFASDAATQRHLILSCHGGAANFSRGSAEIACTPGDVVPVSLGERFSCVTDAEGISDLAIVIDAHRCEEFILQWTGQPALQPVAFTFSLLNPDFATQWRLASDSLCRMMQMAPPPDGAINGLVEHLLKLLLSAHPSNYMQILNDSRVADERNARKAMAMIMADPMRWQTLGALAYALGCPANALNKALRRLAGKGFADIRYEARLMGLHRTLLKGEEGTFIGTLRKFGYAISGRLIREYSRRFGETPGASYHRNPNAQEAISVYSARSRWFNEDAINQFVDSHLSKTIGLADIARHIGLSEQMTIAVFKEQFSTTPMQYVIERRLNRARWLLRNSSISIQAIAIECGFGTQSYLTTTMKRYWGTTPRRVRMEG